MKAHLIGYVDCQPSKQVSDRSYIEVGFFLLPRTFESAVFSIDMQ